MDRFIAICSSKIPTEDEYLKSNMDRFIVFSLSMLDNVKI